MTTFYGLCGECWVDYGKWTIVNEDEFKKFLDERSYESLQEMTKKNLEKAKSERLIELDHACIPCASDVD